MTVVVDDDLDDDVDVTREAVRPNDGAMRAAVIVALVTMAVAAFGVAARSTHGAQTSSDEPQYLLTALSLAEDFVLDISDEIERRAFEPFHEISLNTQTFPLNESGQRLSPHDPLLPIVAAPAMWVGGWVGVRLLLVAIGGLVAGLTTWTAVRRLGVRPSSGVIGVGSMMVGAPIAAYSTQVFPEILAALCVAAIAAAGLVDRLERRHLVVIVIAVVALPWLAVKYAPVAAVATLAVGWRLARERRIRELVWSTGALAVSGILYLYLHQRIYGGWTVYATGDHFIDDGEFAVVGTNPDYLGRSRRLAGSSSTVASGSSRGRRSGCSRCRPSSHTPCVRSDAAVATAAPRRSTTGSSCSVRSLLAGSSPPSSRSRCTGGGRRGARSW